MQENLEPQSHICPRGRATRMVATSSKVSTSIPKPIDIAVTMLLLVYLLFIGMSLSLPIYLSQEIRLTCLGKPSFKKSAVFFNIVQKAFDPPPPLFEHLSYFAGGVF